MITTLFCDLGGVLLTNGWGRGSREAAAKKFGFDLADMETRHQLMFGDYEMGKITLEEYLHHVLFFKPRSFSQEAFVDFMYQQSQPLPGMIEWVKQLKIEHRLRIVLVSNEGLELTRYRTKTFALDQFADIFVVSCFVKMKKPDKAIYRLALDLSQAHPHEVIYFEDRQLFVEIAQEFGIHAIKHVDLPSTQKVVKSLL